MYVRDDFEGCKAAGELFARLHREGRPGPPDWRSVAPPWALDDGERAYYWRAGFTRFWNYLVGLNGWPDSARLRLVFPRIKGGGDDRQGD